MFLITVTVHSRPPLEWSRRTQVYDWPVALFIPICYNVVGQLVCCFGGSFFSFPANSVISIYIKKKTNIYIVFLICEYILKIHSFQKSPHYYGQHTYISLVLAWWSLQLGWYASRIQYRNPIYIMHHPSSLGTTVSLFLLVNSSPPFSTRISLIDKWRKCP